MKNCEEVREMLSLYLDNELHENDRKQVVNHIEGCDACKAELDQLKSMIEVIGEAEEVDLPADFGQKLHEKLVEAHENSYKPAKKNKTSIFMWASSAVAGFVLIFAVVNSSYFEPLLQHSNKSKTAYVNDAKLNMVSKQAMDSAAKKQEVASENVNQNTIVSQSTVRVDGKAANQTKETVPASTNTFGAGNKKTVTTSASDNSAINSDNTATLYDVAKSSNSVDSTSSTGINKIVPPKASSLTLTVNDVSGATEQLNDIANRNGGSIQQPQTFGIMSASSVNETETLSLQIPSVAYDKVMDSIDKIGSVQVQENSSQVQSLTQSSNTLMKSSIAPNAENPDMITLKITIQRKQ